MDGNKDEAQRCIDFAVQALAEGKIEKAEKFLLKAEKLYPTDNAKSKDIIYWPIDGIIKMVKNFFQSCWRR